MLYFGIAAGVLALFLFTLFLIYRHVFFSPHKGQNDHYNLELFGKDADLDLIRSWVNDLESAPCEEIGILARDGTPLFGRYYHRKDGAPLDIAFHGYRGTAFRDMCGGSRISFETEHNLLLVDQRAHGFSKGHTVTFGLRERFDCLDWIAYAKQRFSDDVQILLYGVSMGGATVLYASEFVPIENVRGIVADCPFTSPKDIICKVCEDLHLPPKIFFPLIALSAKIFGKFSPNSESCIDAVKKAGVPILLLHGEEDELVPCEMSAEIARSNPLVEFHSFPDAKHGTSAIVHPEEYWQVTLAFIKRVFKED